MTRGTDRRLGRLAFLTNSFEYSIAFLHLLIVVTLVLTGLHVPVTDTVTAGPWSVTPVMVGFFLGALGMLHGPQIKRGDIGRSVERAGLLLTVATWVAITSTFAVLSPFAAIPVAALALCIIFGCLGRVLALSHVDRALSKVAFIGNDDATGEVK